MKTRIVRAYVIRGTSEEDPTPVGGYELCSWVDTVIATDGIRAILIDKNGSTFSHPFKELTVMGEAAEGKSPSPKEK